ncbi:rhamnose-binding lectin-like [Chlorella sorokiniana]|uniref:Rhamnose-binding lectin-like n=1 Tax=Chlorella sorokiniana TaxID=3076 RepID=A0A2P6U2N0_CHLSO|nr:rhamnose-binding lectin-like [Chlorella sorokiniana]|eukprot:PRW60571.1 rhamnose-binding lectin-like [Chlorella sorokiniana]
MERAHTCCLITSEQLQRDVPELPLPTWELSTSQAQGSSAVPPPRLAEPLRTGGETAAGSTAGRRLAQQPLTPQQLEYLRQQQVQRQQQQQEGDAEVPLHQHAPVLLSIGSGGPAVTAPPTSPRILDASTVNTTRCIRYADWYDPASPGTSREPNATDGSSGGNEQQAGVAAAKWRRPPLDLSACQRSVLEVSTASQRVLVQVRVNAPMLELPPDALSVTAGEVLSVAPPFVQGAFMVFPVTIQLAEPNVRCNISVAAGALRAAAGEPTAASNTLSLLWDLEGPQPRINTVGRYAAASTPRVPLVIDYGERLATLNPLGLFTARGFGRIDVIYDVANGRLYLIGTIPNPLQQAVVTVEVPANVTTDIVGNNNSAATYTLVYSPPSNSSAAVATAMNYIFAASAASYGLGLAGAAVGAPMVIVPIGNDLGAMAGRIQAVYLTGQLNIPTLPSNFRATANRLSYITVDFKLRPDDTGFLGQGKNKTKSQKPTTGSASSEEDLGAAGSALLADLLNGGLSFPAQPVGVVLKRNATRMQVQIIPLSPVPPPGNGTAVPSPPPAIIPTPSPPPPPTDPPNLFTPSNTAGTGMYSIQGNQLFTYLGGELAGPFDLSGLLALVSGSGSGSRRLLGSSGLSISSLDYDGGSLLWLVLSNGGVYTYTIPEGRWVAVPDAGPASVVTLSVQGQAWLINQAGSQLVRYAPASQGVSSRWDLPGGGCTSVAISSISLVAAVCDNRVLVADLAADAVRFEALPGVLACAVAFDAESYMLFSEFTGSCSGVGLVPPRELFDPTEAIGYQASEARLAYEQCMAAVDGRERGNALANGRITWVCPPPKVIQIHCAFLGDPDTGCMCANAAAMLEQAARACNGRRSCALLAAARGLAVLADNVCAVFGGCDFLCPNAIGNCQGADIQAVIQYRSAIGYRLVLRWCSGRPSCTLRAINAYFGDPCIGLRKRLWVRYRCIRAASPPPSPPPPGDSELQEGTATILEGTTGTITCLSGQIQPAGAAWGIEGVCQDSSDAVYSAVFFSQECSGARSCQLTPQESWLGDPCDGISSDQKTLTVYFTCCEEPLAMSTSLAKPQVVAAATVSLPSSLPLATTGVQVNASNAASAILPDAVAKKLEALVTALGSMLTVTSGSSLQSLWNSLFWIAVALAAVLALHVGIRALIIWRRWPMPLFFEWPRPELLLMWAVLPIIAAQGSKLLRGETSAELAWGVVFGVLLPAAMLALSVFLVVKHLALVGEWVPTDAYSASFVARFGVLFETSRGPSVKYQPGTWQFDPATGTFDRGRMVPLSPLESRRARAVQVAKTLGVTVQLTKMVLFAQLAAALSASDSSGSNSQAVWQVIPLLVLTVVYWAYLRIFVPLASFVDMFGEVVSCACDLGTFVCGLLVAVLPASNAHRLQQLGIAMLVFQLVGMLCSMVPRAFEVLAAGAIWLWRRWRPSPADKFAAVVRAVMAQDRHILARKYCDRWLLRVHGRGLNQRALHYHEKGRSALPFAVTLHKPLTRALTRKLTRALTSRKRASSLWRSDSARRSSIPPRREQVAQAGGQQDDTESGGGPHTTNR